MEKERKWPKQRLKKLHSVNAWVVLALAITGLILFFPQFRGPLASIRVALKELHILIGVILIVLLLVYLPSLSKHMKRIRRKKNQRYNLLFTLFLMIGWGGSGLILWQFRNLPAVLSSIALFAHDLFSYVGIPYFLYHAVSRSRWVKRAINHKAVDSEWIDKKQPSFARRRFMRVAAGTALVFIVGPFFYRWLKGTVDNGDVTAAQTAKTDGNHMVPPPEPAPSSLPPKGGGGEGQFRAYTVTQIPSFSSDTWQFSISGLVNQPIILDWRGFLKLPRKVQVSDFHCVTGWSVYHVTWEGVLLSDLLKKAGIKRKAKFVKFYSGDGVYTDTLTIKQARMDDVMVAVLRDGKPIPQNFGGPTRLVVPNMYGYKSVKWLNKIELIDHSWTGFWEKRGYKKDAWVSHGGTMF